MRNLYKTLILGTVIAVVLLTSTIGVLQHKIHQNEIESKITQIELTNSNKALKLAIKNSEKNTHEIQSLNSKLALLTKTNIDLQNRLDKANERIKSYGGIVEPFQKKVAKP